MDFVRLKLVYMDSTEMTGIMQRWVAECFLFLFGEGYQWTPGMRVCRAWIVAD